MWFNPNSPLLKEIQRCDQFWSLIVIYSYADSQNIKSKCPEKERKYLETYDDASVHWPYASSALVDMKTEVQMV